MAEVSEDRSTRFGVEKLPQGLRDDDVPLKRRPSDLQRRRVFERAEKMFEPMEQLAIELKGALLATGLGATCYLLFWFKAVLVPFFLAIFLMYLVDPIVEILDVSPRHFFCVCTRRGRHARRRSRGCSRAFASTMAVLVVCVFCGLLGYITTLSINALDVTAYQDGYSKLVLDVEKIMSKVGLTISIKATLKDNVDQVAKLVVTDFVDLLSIFCVTMIYLTYFLCTRVRPGHAGGVWAKVDNDVQRFVTLKAYLSLAVAILVTIVYVSLNVGLAIVWGILTFLLNWIPNIGAMVASVLPMMIIMITPNNLMSGFEKFLAIILPACFHFFVGSFIEPRLLGRKLEMDPVVVIFSLSAWGLLWGVVGMMLSVPLTATFKIMLTKLNIWPSMVAMMEGRYFDPPNCTPIVVNASESINGDDGISTLELASSSTFKDGNEYTAVINESLSPSPDRKGRRKRVDRETNNIRMEYAETSLDIDDESSSAKPV